MQGSKHIRLKKPALLNACYIILVVLPTVSSNQENVNRLTSQSSNHATQKISPHLSSQIILHGFLLWASVGFLTPVGILIIRMSNRQDSGRKIRILYYFHAVIQTLSVLIITAAAVMSIRSFDNSFNNCHQRLGLALYIAAWLQAMVGFFRPPWGTKGRSLWFFLHWMLGTVVSLLGIINIYSGLQAYHKRTHHSSKIWTILFTSEIAFIAFFYLFQEKWEYIQKQGVTRGGTSTRPISQQFSPHNMKNKPEIGP